MNQNSDFFADLKIKVLCSHHCRYLFDDGTDSMEIKHLKILLTNKQTHNLSLLLALLISIKTLFFTYFKVPPKSELNKATLVAPNFCFHV